MKRLIAIFAVLALAAGMAAAVPTIYGSNGLFRIISAQNAGPMNFGIGAYVYGWTWYGDSTAAVPKQGATDLVITPSGYFSINDMFELSVGTNYLMPSSYVEVGGTKYKYNPSGLGDTRIGLKASIPGGHLTWLGAYVGYDLPTLADTFLPGDNYKHNGGINIMVLFDRKFGDHACMNLNAGMYYNMDKYYQRTTLTDSSLVNVYPNMSIPFGMGFSYDMGMLTPYAEISSAFMPDTTSYPNTAGTGTVKRGILDSPVWAGAGLRFYLSGLNITAGGEYNLQADDRRGLSPAYLGDEHWHVILGLAYAPKRAGSEASTTGIITGKVTDKATGNGLLATVSAGGITANTTPAGDYRLEGIAIETAPVEVRAEAKLYLTGSAAVQLTRKNRRVPAIQDFALVLKPIPQSNITGNVMDYKTGSPVAAAVLSFKDSTGKFQTAKCDYKGAYDLMLDQGEYYVKVGADGYFPKSLIMHPMNGAPVPRQNIFLVKLGEKFNFNDVNFTIGNATLGPNAPQLLESIAKILRDNPEIRVEIGGHTSSPGSNAYNQKLSEARANVVREALITTYGINKDRLTHKGYGEDFPIATNNTKEGRALNRRMEVTVIQ